MGNREVSRATPLSSSHGAVVATTDSTDEQPDETKYAEVTIFAEELATTEDGTIQLKKLIVWNYFRLSSTHNSRETQTRKFFMYYKKSNGQLVQLGICEEGPFGPASITGNCSEITFTGPDTKFYMSNKVSNTTLYLRGRKSGKTVNSYKERNDNSYFSLWIRPDGFGSNNTAICIIFVVNRPKLAFRYSESDKVVKTKQFSNSDPAFLFQLTPVNPTAVEFVDNHI